MNRKWVLSLMSACLLQALITSPALAENKIKYGEWEVSMTVQGLPMQVPSQTERICLDKEHLVPGEQESHECKVKWQIKDSTVSWSISCKNGATGTGRVVYNWDTMQGSSDMSMPSRNVNLHSSIKGNWIADSCTVR